MSAESPREITLEDVAEFHQQLMRLDAAGLSLQLDEGFCEQRDLPRRLNEIMAELATQSSRAKSLSDILANRLVVPTRYRLALESWVVGDRSTDALAMLRQPVQAEQEGSADLNLALVLPLVILVVIYCASFYLLWVTLPRIEAIYAQFFSMTPSIYVRVLIAVRDAMPIWVPGLPLLVLILGLLISMGRLRLPRWLPGRSRAFHYLNAALVARNLAMQLENGDSTFEVESRLRDSKGRDSNGRDSESRLSDSRPTSTVRRALQSPMLRWALMPATASNPMDDSTTDASQQSRRLRLAARLFETMQVNHFQRFRTALMFITCVIVGGGLTLLYALALFAPLIQLLKDIT